MKSKNILIYSLIFGLVLVALCIVVYLKESFSNDNYFNCHGAARIINQHINSDLIIRIKTNGNKRIFIAFSGVVNSEHDKYTIEREFYADYFTNKSIITLHNLTLKKKEIDNLPDSLFEFTAWKINDDTVHFEITKLKNSFVISNPFTPIMICIK